MIRHYPMAMLSLLLILLLSLSQTETTAIEAGRKVTSEDSPYATPKQTMTPGKAPPETFPLVYPYRQNRLWGFRSKEGKNLTKAIYRNVQPKFSEGLVAVNNDGKLNFLNTEGSVELETEYEYLSDFDQNFHDNLALVRVRRDMAHLPTYGYKNSRAR